MTEAFSPPGWPAELPPPGTAEFEAKVVGWLLDQAPAEFRSHEVFRKHPRVLAWAVAQYTDGALQASRAAYASARADLTGQEPPEAVVAVLRALEFEGVRLRALQRQLVLIGQALAGGSWRRRL